MAYNQRDLDKIGSYDRISDMREDQNTPLTQSLLLHHRQYIDLVNKNDDESFQTKNNRSIISSGQRNFEGTTSASPAYQQKNNKEKTYNLGYVINLTLISAIGGFLFGYDTGVIAGAKLYFSDTWSDISEVEKGTIVSLAQLGSAIGSLIAGPFADKYGRKKTIIGADFFFTIGAIVMGLAPTIPVLILGRFLVGFGVGVAAMIVPVYLSEAAPTEIRGSLVTFNCLFITGGQFISYLICIALGRDWRLMLGLAATPSVIQMIGMLFMPETPVFLYKIGKSDEADKALGRLYKSKYLEQKKEEIKQEVENVKIESRDPFLTQIKNLFTIYTRCIVLGAGLQFWQQFCGINTVMYFGPDILQKSGFGDENDPSSLLIASLPLAGMNALGTLVAIFYIDKLGRRYILLRMVPFIGASLLVISLGLGLKGYSTDLSVGDAGKWVSLTGILLYLAFFSISLGCTPWTINSEIYPLHLRGAGNSVSTTTNWVSNYVVSQFFLLVTTTTTGQVVTFACIAAFCGACWVFVYYICPETKGKPIEQIVEEICPHTKKNEEHLKLKDNDQYQQQNQHLSDSNHTSDN